MTAPPGDNGDAGPSVAATASAISPTDPRLVRCAFAVLRGKGVHETDDGRQVDEFFIRSFDVTLGRRSRGGGADVVISGDNMNISRQHARIRFNFEQGCWELLVLSKNGVMLNGVNLQPPLRKEEEEQGGEENGGGASKPPPPVPVAIARLASGDALSVGDRGFSFLLPSKRAAVLTTDGALEPGWLLGGAASGNGVAAAVGGGGGGIASPRPAAAAAPPPPPPPPVASAAAAAPIVLPFVPAVAPRVPGARPDTAQTRSVENSVEREEEMEEDGGKEKGGGEEEEGEGKG